MNHRPGTFAKRSTYVWTAEGWLYLATVIDLFNRQVVGFAMGERMGARLVADALRMAWFRRRPAPGLIFHSARGSQYAGKLFAAQIKAFKMRASMSRKGDCWDNAVAESLFGSLKTESLNRRDFETRRAASDEIMAWIATYWVASLIARCSCDSMRLRVDAGGDSWLLDPEPSRSMSSGSAQTSGSVWRG